MQFLTFNEPFNVSVRQQRAFRLGPRSFGQREEPLNVCMLELELTVVPTPHVVDGESFGMLQLARIEISNPTHMITAMPDVPKATLP